MPEQESEIDTQNQGREHLTEEAAHDEANLMRGDIMMKEGGGGFKSEEAEQLERRGVTPEDYHGALQAVEELKNLVEKEPASAKVMYQVGRMLHNIGRIPGGVAFFIGLMGDAFYSKFTEPSRYDTSIDWSKREESLPITDSLIKLDQWLKNQLTDASKKLAEREGLGKAYAKRELKRDEKN